MSILRSVLRSRGGGTPVTLTRNEDGTVTARIGGATQGYLYYSLDGGATVETGLVDLPYTIPGTLDADAVTFCVGQAAPATISIPSTVAPIALFSDSEVGAWFDPSDISTLWQDTAGTVPVTRAGQTVKRIDDKSGNGTHATQADSAKAPTYQVDGSGQGYLLDGNLQTSTVDFSGGDKLTLIAGIAKLTDAGAETAIGLGNVTQPGAFELFAPNGTGSHRYVLAVNGGTTFAQATPAQDTFTAPLQSVVSGVIDYSLTTAEGKLYVDGTLAVSTSGDTGSGNLRNAPIDIGSRQNGSQYFTGRFYGGALVGAEVSATARGKVEAWMAERLMQAGWEEERPIRFGAIGDSITRNSYAVASPAGLGDVPQWQSRAWPLWATQLTARRAWTDINAVEGYSGYTSAEILAAMLEETNVRTIGTGGNTAEIPYGVRAVKPDYCFTLIGTNDIRTGLVAMGDFIDNLEAIWAALRAVGVEPVAVSLLPANSPATHQANVTTWNAAIEAAADAAGIIYCDVYTNCNDGSGGFKAGWTYIGGIEDPTGLHPGNEAAHQMAADIAATLNASLPVKNRTPYVSSATEFTISDGHFTEVGTLADTLGGGLFSSTTGWGARYENAATTASVSAVAPAQVGNALTVTLPTPGSDVYSDRYGPAAVAVTPGETYGVTARISFAAGHQEDALVFGLMGGAGIGECLWQMKSLDSKTASTSAGASLGARDVYFEVTIPPGVTSVRPWVLTTGKAASTGAELSVAQLGMTGPL